MFKKINYLLISFLAPLIGLISCAPKNEPVLKVAVATNFLTTADTLVEVFKRSTGIEVLLISGSSGQLATQVINGAPYDIFLSAKQAGLNIGVLSALIQAGALSEDEALSRPRLVLEAQAFNLLTDREKRNFIALGPKYNYDILESIHKAKKESLVGDDNKPLMKDSAISARRPTSTATLFSSIHCSTTYDRYPSTFSANSDLT